MEEEVVIVGEGDVDDGGRGAERAETGVDLSTDIEGVV